MQYTQENQTSFPRQFNSDGTKNPTYVDLLEEDKPISGQKFACISFVSPENILKQKEHYLFQEKINKRLKLKLHLEKLFLSKLIS